MRDRLQTGKWLNQPVKNPIQAMARRFVRVPGSGLPNYLEDTQNKFREFGNELFKTQFTELMREGND